MDIEAFVSQVLADQTPLLPGSLPDDEADVLVERLKSEADRHWRINAHISLRCADVIIQVGQTLENSRIVALGLMARGDALKLLNQSEEAWETLDRAGALYLSVGDEVGWARTRIGRLGICVNLNRVDTAMREAEQAREIFLRYGEQEKLLRLQLNAAAVYDQLGDFRESRTVYDSALGIAERLGEIGQARVGMIYNNIGYIEQEMGNLRNALSYYEQAKAIWEARGENTGVALTELNIAAVAQAQGKFRKALHLLYDTQETLNTNLPSETAYAQRCMIECYLSLNRYEEARVLAEKFVREQTHEQYHLALVLLHLATAQVYMRDFIGAQGSLDKAAAIFADLKSDAWLAATYLRRGQVALEQGDLETAQREAHQAVDYFKANHQQIDYTIALLLNSRIALSGGDLKRARVEGQTALRFARQAHVASLRYGTHVLLGKVAEQQRRVLSAIRHYRVAAATIERVQSGLTITLRPGFLEDKQDALRSLIRLHLENNQYTCAFEMIERAKSQLWLSYLTNREQLRWTHDDPRTRPLIDELNRLREEHHWFYRLAHDQSFREVQRITIPSHEAASEAVAREQKMRILTERLYLHGEEDESALLRIIALEDIQAGLDADTLLIEFYSDHSGTWAFLVNHRGLEVHKLQISSTSLLKLIEQLQANFARVLRAGSTTSSAHTLTKLAKALLKQGYDALIAPLAKHLSDYRRLMVVPYGALHYLPFHLLYDGVRHLIETHEIVILPASGLATRKSPQCQEGALILAHSWEDRLPNTIAEAELVRQRLNGTLYSNEDAARSAFSVSPRQILHIAAHGQHRIDQPDFSYIQLGDGQLLTDDLLQYDLSYELVTLSACETGRANVAAGDELIGLGRGFLYAGAGALVASLWRVDDMITVRWMDEFYGCLQAGKSKAAALRNASLTILDDQPELHPAYWGAFQLVGNADPLSTFAAH